MLSFVNDYSEGAHPKLLERLTETNFEQLAGYGSDPYCERAKEKIRTAIGCPEAEVFFLVGGTQTNQVVFDALLRPYDGVIAAASGHVNVHEAGAIEHGGHKVLALAHTEGKLSAQTVREYLRTFYADGNYTHMVFPGAVYISHPTEYGTLYTKAELAALHEACAEYHIPLFLDGARLGYGLAAGGTDVTLRDVAALTDVFYIGGTKVGALCGEAVVFPHGGMPANFLTIVKQHGALLAKGRLLGVQFDALMENGVYEKVGAYENEMADRLREGIRAAGYPFYCETTTNQLFPVLPNAVIDRLEKDFGFYRQNRVDEGHQAIRLVTSWNTQKEEADALIRALKE